MKKARIRLMAALLPIMLVVPAGAIHRSDALAQTDPGASPPAVSQTQVAQPNSGVNWQGAGYGAASLLCNLIYIPFKLTYALLGGLVGGGAYLITAGNGQASDAIWRSSLGGDYVLTPAMIAGDQPINFSGPTGTPPVETSATTTNGAATTDGNVQPITPIPPPAPSTAATSPAGNTRSLDSGSGPVSNPSSTKRSSAPADTSIE